MLNQKTKLPAVAPEAQLHSKKLLNIIIETIQNNNGSISFAEYMQKCLYFPGLGYYSAGLSKFGVAGDFVTAPEISPLFSQSLASHVVDVLKQMPSADCLEFGAGSGRLAVDLLLQLAEYNALPSHYFILEASADLREKQRNLIRNELSWFSENIIWLDTLPEKFNGIVIANEVCDAMPVHSLLFESDNIMERTVGLEQKQLVWLQQSIISTSLSERAKNIHENLPFYPFLAEINLQSEAWLASLAEMLQQGAIFIIDYGHAETEYFHSQRASGGIHCHYQHQVHDNPLILPGLQDITAAVNFTALAETAANSGLQVTGFQHQADFLLAADITELAQEDPLDPLMQMQQSAALKRLLLPDQMGERFKVLTLTCQLENLPRVQLRDGRFRL